jgi:putative transposase
LAAIGDLFDDLRSQEGKTNYSADIAFADLLSLTEFDHRSDASRDRIVKPTVNPHRRHSALDYRSPVEYERLHREHSMQTMRSSAAAGGAWPADHMLAGTPQTASASNAEPITLSGPASNR